jgi:glycosyltransferase involved in cell wall biosynthesis
MAPQKLPFMSVIVPVYNGAATIGRALDSLQNQDYPKNRYEVIAVNDGSTDDSADVLKARTDVRYVELPRNMGIPSAQNAGLAAAKGDIYVNFNDDCQAAPDFLTQLAKGYAELDKPLGIGGIVVKQAAGHVKGLVANYIEASGTGAAPGAGTIGPDFLPGPAKRLLSYLFGNYVSRKRQKIEHHDVDKVVELYGANASFPIDKLRAVGGWDVEMAAPAIGGIEDRDVCYRLQQKFPDHHFYAIHSARVVLEQDPDDTAVSFKTYLLRPYRRGPFNYAFHAKNGLTPPIFPFPLLIVLIVTATVFFAPLIALLELLILPILCYGWWIQRAILERRALYVLLPYLQLAEETMVIAGLLRGMIVHNRKKHAVH